MNSPYIFEQDTDDQWLCGVRRIESPNYDERPLDGEVDLLVIHAISLPPKQFGGTYIDQLFTNSLDSNEHDYFKEIEGLEVSTHLFINRKGEVTQYVPLNKRAWHAGESEFCGQTICNDFSIGIELEGCDELPFETIQYQELAMLTQFIVGHWQGVSKERIVGHSDISPGRKTDPGPCFDWDKYFQLLDSLTISKGSE